MVDLPLLDACHLFSLCDYNIQAEVAVSPTPCIFKPSHGVALANILKLMCSHRHNTIFTTEPIVAPWGI